MDDVLLAQLLNVSADLIADHPEAAAKLARRLSAVLQQEAERRAERNREMDAETRRRGY